MKFNPANCHLGPQELQDLGRVHKDFQDFCLELEPGGSDDRKETIQKLVRAKRLIEEAMGVEHVRLVLP